MRFGPKVEALRRSVVRLFGRAATQGRGEIPRTPPQEAAYVLTADGLKVSYGGPFVNVETACSAPAPEPMDPPITWEKWCGYEADHRRDGWAFCRYPIRSRPPENAIHFVYGLVRGHFGVHVAPMMLGTPLDKEAPTWHVIHLRGGFGCGVFLSSDAATTAAEIAMRLAVDWADFDPDKDDRLPLAAMLGRAHLAWVNAGLTPAPFLAHHIARPDIMPLNVWYQDFTPTERPESLS